jgi:uncharacterized protein (TIGR03437 family)
VKNLFLRLACRHGAPAWWLASLCPLLLGGFIWLSPHTGAAARVTTGTLKANAVERQGAMTNPSGTGSPNELYVDDGSFESALRSTRGEPESYVNLLTPFSYPATLTGISIFFSGSAPPVGTPITLLVANKAGSDDQNTTFQTLESTIRSIGQFVTYDFPAFTITSGDFVVGFRTTSAPGQFPIALDVTPPLQRRSYMAIHGLTFWLIDDLNFAGNLGIRARLASSCPAVSSMNPASGAAGTRVTINGANFTGVTGVKFANNVAAQFTVNSDTSITATIPTGAVSGPITISKAGCADAQTSALTIANAVTNVSATSFLGAELAPESIVSAFGAGLATSLLNAQTTPLPTTLAGTRVLVRDGNGVERLAPLFFVSPTQINYLLPPGTATGTATITVTSGNGTLSVGTVRIALVAPGLFTANASGQGVPAGVALHVKANSAQSTEPVAQFDAATARFIAAPIDLGPEGEQVFLILFGTGFRAVSSLSNLTARIGGINAEVSFAGAQGGLTGMDQANLRIPRSLVGRGEVDLMLTVDGKAANTVRINIK